MPHKIIAVNRDFSFECGREREMSFGGFEKSSANGAGEAVAQEAF